MASSAWKAGETQCNVCRFCGLLWDPILISVSCFGEEWGVRNKRTGERNLVSQPIYERLTLENQFWSPGRIWDTSITSLKMWFPSPSLSSFTVQASLQVLPVPLPKQRRARPVPTHSSKSSPEPAGPRYGPRGLKAILSSCFLPSLKQKLFDFCWYKINIIKGRFINIVFFSSVVKSH